MEAKYNPYRDNPNRTKCEELIYDQGYEVGIREVVELIDKTGLIEHTDSPLHEIGATILDCPACCWYVYKKEWGL